MLCFASGPSHPQTHSERLDGGISSILYYLPRMAPKKVVCKTKHCDHPLAIPQEQLSLPWAVQAAEDGDVLKNLPAFHFPLYSWRKISCPILLHCRLSLLHASLQREEAASFHIISNESVIVVV